MATSDSVVSAFSRGGDVDGAVDWISSVVEMLVISGIIVLDSALADVESIVAVDVVEVDTTASTVDEDVDGVGMTASIVLEDEVGVTASIVLEDEVGMTASIVLEDEVGVTASIVLEDEVGVTAIIVLEDEVGVTASIVLEDVDEVGRAANMVLEDLVEVMEVWLITSDVSAYTELDSVVSMLDVFTPL